MTDLMRRTHECGCPKCEAWLAENCTWDGCDYHEPLAPEPTVVSGNRLFLTRLDEQGKPTSERIEVQGGSLTIGIGADEEFVPEFEFKNWSTTYTLVDPDPEMIRLLLGLPPRPWYWRWLPRPIKHYIKRKEIRRGYGG